MATHFLILSDEETAAAKWSLAHNADPAIDTVEKWIYTRLRGELIAAVSGYKAARASGILDAIDAGAAGDVKRIVSDVEKRVQDPPPKDPVVGDVPVEGPVISGK